MKRSIQDIDSSAAFHKIRQIEEETKLCEGTSKWSCGLSISELSSKYETENHACQEKIANCNVMREMEIQHEKSISECVSVGITLFHASEN